MNTRRQFLQLLSGAVCANALYQRSAFADERSFAEIAASIRGNLHDVQKDVSKLPDDYKEFEEFQAMELEELKKAGLRVEYTSLALYKADEAGFNARVGVSCDALAIRLEEGQAHNFYNSVSSRQGYAGAYDNCGNVVYSSGGSQCLPCYQQPQQQYCDSGPCPGATQFQQYNQGRRLGQRILGQGYNGRTLGSTMQAAPLMRPYLITHAFRRLENPTRIGQGRILNFLFPRIRYKNGYICSEHDMKVHLGRRQWAILIATSAATAGAGGGAMLLPIVP